MQPLKKSKQKKSYSKNNDKLNNLQRIVFAIVYWLSGKQKWIVVVKLD